MNQPEIDQAVADDLSHMAMQIFTNPLILPKVFNSLDVKTLKSARLVCPAWTDLATTFLGRKARITFSSSLNLANSKELTSFNHKLAKNVALLMKCDCFGTCSCPPEDVESWQNLPPNFVILLPEICDKLDTLKFLVGRTFEPRWHEILRTHQFPNLTQISIIVANICHEQDEVEVVPRPDRLGLEVPEFRPLSNLKVLSIVMLPGYEPYFVANFLSPITQGLLNCAPNLEKFELTGKFYPDLTPCRKLDEVKFEFQYGEYSGRLDIPGLTRMLENCRDSLKKLTLGYPGRLWWGPVKLDFHFPNLTHLKIDTSMAYEIEDSLNIINLPRLTHFSIASSSNISKMIENFHLPHAGITSFHVTCTYAPGNDNYDGRSVAKLVNLFPAVNEFKLEVAIEFVLDENCDDYVRRNVGDKDLLALKETLQSLGGWGLTSGGHVEIKLEWGYSFEELDAIGASVMQGVTEWSGLANTCLKFEIGGSFKLLDGMRDALLSCKTIRSVTWERFQMDEQDSIELNAFVGENNLPMSVPGFCTGYQF